MLETLLAARTNVYWQHGFVREKILPPIRATAVVTTVMIRMRHE